MLTFCKLGPLIKGFFGCWPRETRYRPQPPHAHDRRGRGDALQHRNPLRNPPKWRSKHRGYRLDIRMMVNIQVEYYPTDDNNS